MSGTIAKSDDVREKNLYVISEPMLLFGGPCSNAESTQAILELAQEREITPDRIICTGDLAAYCANPKETVERIRDSGIHVVMGNCEESLGNDADDCGCGFEAGSSCDVLSVAWYRHACAELSDDDRKWMAELPHRISFSMNGLDATVVHGSVDEINQFVFPGTDAELKASQLQNVDKDIVIGGHSGVPFTQQFGDRLWHNPGIIGIPANDGTDRVWYSIMSPENDGIRIEHRALHYDVESAATALENCPGLPNDYAKTLRSGLWPSDEVMPDADRAQRGVPLEEFGVVWASH